MKGDYQKLLKSVDSMNKKVSAARTKIEAMQGTGNTYFQGRAATIKAIQSRRRHEKHHPTAQNQRQL